jgi:hypothetical protein
MRRYIASYIEQNKKPPTDIEINEESYRLYTQLQVDLPNTGTFNTPATDEEKAAEARMFEAIRNWTPAQQANAYVEFEDIEPGLLAKIRADLKAAGTTETQTRVEQIAAAFVLGDRARLQRLVEGN